MLHLHRIKVSPMRAFLSFVLITTAAAACFPQLPGASNDASIDPKAILASAAQFHHLTNTDQHPWYLRATYQVYDDQGKPSEQGTYEYWWVAPRKYRATWSRGTVNASIWADGDAPAVFSGHPELLGFSEGLLGLALVPAVPAQDDVGKFDLSYVQLDLVSIPLRCVVLSPRPSSDGAGSQLALVPRFSGLCMDKAEPTLRLLTSGNGETVGYAGLELFRGQYLPRQVSFERRKSRKWDATIVEIKEIGGDDQALIPPPKAKPLQASMPQSNYPSLQPIIKNVGWLGRKRHLQLGGGCVGAAQESYSANLACWTGSQEIRAF